MTMVKSDGTASSAIKILYNKQFLMPFDENLQYHKLAQKEPFTLNAGEGKTVEWTRWLKLAEVTSALTEGDPGTEQTFTTQILRATPEEWGAYEKVSKFYEFTNIDPRLMNLSKLNGDQASRTIELNTVKEWGKYGGIPVLANNDLTQEYHDVPVTTATSTTVINLLSLGGKANDFFNGGRCCFTEATAACFGEARTVSDFVTSTGVTTLDTALHNTPTTSGKVSIAAPNNLTETDIINSTAVKRADFYLRKYEVPPLKKGYYGGFFDPALANDMTEDELWQKLNIEHSSGPRGVFENEVGSIWGVAFTRGSKSWRSTAAAGATYSGTGTIHSCGIFGQHCMGVVDCKGQGLHIIHTPAKIAEPMLHRWSSMGWVIMYKAKALNSVCSVNLFCGSAN